MKTQDIAHYRAAEKRLWDHYGVTPSEHYVDLPTLNTRVRVLEVGQGEPVLFIHGSPNAGSTWIPLAAKLTDFRCLILDRPGCGLSEPVDYTTINLREFGATLLSSTLDGLGLPEAAIIGSSLGGVLAFYFAQACAERVVWLVQEGCPPMLKGGHIPLRNIVSSVLSLLFGITPSSRAAFRHLGHGQRMDSEQWDGKVLVWRDALLKYTDTARHENNLSLNILRGMKGYQLGIETLQQIQPATLYLWGEHDPFGGVELGKKCADAQPSAILKSFPLSGHLPWLDDPQLHAELVRAFSRNSAMATGFE